MAGQCLEWTAPDKAKPTAEPPPPTMDESDNCPF
jgi:hypothetical protein